MLKNHVDNFLEIGSMEDFLNWSDSSLYYKKLFFKIKNGADQNDFQATLV